MLALAEQAVLAKGFSATSIEEMIAAVGITKSGFFYHFKDKGELAKALLLRYLEQDREVLDGIFRRGEKLAAAVEELRELVDRSRRIGVACNATGGNPELVTAYRTRMMLKLALVIAYGALQRTESRGGHTRG